MSTSTRVTVQQINDRDKTLYDITADGHGYIGTIVIYWAEHGVAHVYPPGVDSYTVATTGQPLLDDLDAPLRELTTRAGIGRFHYRADYAKNRTTAR